MAGSTINTIEVLMTITRLFQNVKGTGNSSKSYLWDLRESNGSTPKNVLEKKKQWTLATGYQYLPIIYL